MKNYFIPDISPEKKKKLQEAAVAFCEMELDGEAGIVVDDASITNFLKVIEAEIKTEFTTTYEGIVKISLKYVDISAPTVTVEDWDGRQQDEFCAFAHKILVPVVKRNIVFHVPHKRTAIPLEDEIFHIWIWSSTSGSANKTPPEKIWGISTDCRDPGFFPSGTGILITDGETGWVVAELIRNNLFIHHDLCERGTDRELAIFRRLCEEVAVELSASPREKAERQKRLAEERRQASRNAYIKECSHRFEKTIEGTRQAITTGRNEVARLQQALVKKIREVQGAERKLEQLNSCKGGELEKYGREFDKLMVVSKVRDVQVTDGVVKVFTDTLYCTDPRSKVVHEIGAFRIEIYRDCQNGGVKWFNLTRKIDGYKRDMQAPHVFQEGNACYGNTAEIWPELIGNYEFAAAAMVAIQFIESVNTDDSAGKHIDKWPVVQTGKEEK